jgi:YfiH family protein
VGDVPERVRLNRQALLRALPPGLREPVVGEQVHGARVALVGALHAGARWEAAERSLAETDALVTAEPCLPLVTLTADCLPVALADSEGRVAAAVHAGWRGLAAGVLENTLAAMRDCWGSRTATVHAWIGPAIGPCCYEVGAEVAAHFLNSAQPAGERFRLDLPAAAVARLAAAGVPAQRIGTAGLCTACRADLFFSHRRETLAGPATTGRQAMLVWLEPAPGPDRLTS